MASSWILFFSYQDDARSNTHQIINDQMCMVSKEGKSGKIKRKETELWVEMMVNQFRHKAMSVQRMLPVNMDEKINQNKGGVRQARLGIP